MPKAKQDIIQQLQRLGKRLDLVLERQRPAKDNSFEPIKAIVQTKWEREQQAKQRAKASVSDDNRVYFPCPSCRTKLGLNFNDRGQAVDAAGSRFRRAFLCPSCNHLVPRSFMARMERKVRLARQSKGLNKSREPLFLDDESNF